MSAVYVDRLRAVYDHWSRGDFKSDASLFGPDFQWRQAPDAVEPATHRGREGAARMARRVFEVFEDFRIVPIEFVDAGDRVVVFSRIHATSRGTGLELDRPYIQVWTFREGAPVRVEDHAGREDALTAVGLHPSSDAR